MGHWSYLVANRTSSPNYFLDWFFEHDDIQIIMAAKYRLPPLWHSVFQESDLHICSLTVDDVEISHPIYITSAEIGIQRALDRRSKFCSLFPENIEHIYDKWMNLLELFKGRHIHMDWSDVSKMGDINEVERMNLGVQAGIRTFESDSADDWNACFGNSNTIFDTATKQASPHPYTKNVPGALQRDLYGHHFIRKINKKGVLEWSEEDS